MLENKAQEVYDNLWVEAVDRADARGLKPPSEELIFQTLVRAVRDSIAQGDQSAVKFLEQLKEVVPVKVRAEADFKRANQAVKNKVIEGQN